MGRFQISCSDCLNEKCFIRQNCSDEVLKDVDANKFLNRYAKSQHVFYEDNEADSIFFVQKGSVKVTKNGAFDKDQIVRFSLGGDILGHRGFSSSGVYPVSAQAIMDSVVCQFSKDYFFQLLNKVPQLSINLMLFYANELNREEAKSRDMILFNVREKVAKALLILIERFGLNEQDIIRDMELLNRQDIAECVGLTSNQVTKVLGEFRKDKLIETKGKKIKILKKEDLEEIVSY